jgi:hypothetical protein
MRLRLSLRDASDNEVDTVVAADEAAAAQAALVMLGRRPVLQSGDALYCRGEQIGDILPAEVSRIAGRLERRALSTTGNDDMKAAALLRLFAETMREQNPDDDDAPPIAPE